MWTIVKHLITPKNVKAKVYFLDKKTLRVVLEDTTFREIVLLQLEIYIRKLLPKQKYIITSKSTNDIEKEQKKYLKYSVELGAEVLEQLLKIGLLKEILEEHDVSLLVLKYEYEVELVRSAPYYKPPIHLRGSYKTSIKKIII